MGGATLRREDIRKIVDDQFHLAEGLVRLVPFSQKEISTEIRRLREALLDAHLDPNYTVLSDRSEVPSRIIHARLESEHRIFPTSIEQLEWFFKIVREDDHGGNRQALGQYWKLLLEALAHHLEDEGGPSVGLSTSHA